MDLSTGGQPRAAIYSHDWHQWRDPEVPDLLQPTWYLLERHLDQRARDPALVVDGRFYTYGELAGAVASAASGLTDLDIRPGERMLMFGTDSYDYIVFWLAAVRQGVIPVTISDLVSAQQLGYFLRDSDPTALYMDSTQSPKVATVASAFSPNLRHIIVCGTTDLSPRGTPLFHRSSDLLKAGQVPPPPFHRHAQDPAYMLYSGSTTGPAKGILHLAHDFLLIPERQGAFWEYGPTDRVHATSKKYFTHGLWPGVLMPLYHGAVSVISTGPPSPANVVSLIESVRPTKLITVPTVVKAILGWIDESGRTPDFTSLGLIVTASERMPPAVFERFRAVSGVEVMDSIGSSEVTYEWIANRPREHRQGSLGKPIFGVEVRLVSAEGTDVVEPGEPGEAWVKSRTSFLYYWRKLDQTRETQIGPWTRTGDVLTFDGDGFFWFIGRNDDLFKVKGMWVSPLEIEAEIARHPGVREVAVVGVEADGGLMAPRAFVVLRPDIAPTDELAVALKKLVERLGRYKVPDQVVFIEDLPRTALMKIDRRELRRRCSATR